MYRPTVSATQTYSYNQGKHIACKGKLLVLANGPTPDQCIPIIISETEDLGVGDYAYDTHFQSIFVVENEYKLNTVNGVGYCDKILALPEHFSPKYLQSIVDGRMKDGDEVLIKCAFCVSYQTKAPDIGWDRIHLNKRKHITLFPLE